MKVSKSGVCFVWMYNHPGAVGQGVAERGLRWPLGTLALSEWDGVGGGAWGNGSGAAVVENVQGRVVAVVKGGGYLKEGGHWGWPALVRGSMHWATVAGHWDIETCGWMGGV